MAIPLLQLEVMRMVCSQQEVGRDIYLTVHYPIWGQWFVGKSGIIHWSKMPSVLHLYTAGAVWYRFWWNYTTEKFQTTHCGYHDQTIKAPQHQCWFTSNNGWWSEIWWVIIPSAVQFGNVVFVVKVAEIHVRSANEAYVWKHISRFSMWQYDGIVTIKCITFII